MDPSTTLKKLKEQAEMTAMRKLQSLFNTSDQLEQIEQHINRIDKRKVNKKLIKFARIDNLNFFFSIRILLKHNLNQLFNRIL